MKSKLIDLTELRIKIDQMNERIISGLKERSRYPLNEGIYKKEFFEGKTWFLYRLKKEQDIDSQFGRYHYSDQVPLFFEKEELENPLDNRNSPVILGLSSAKIDKSKEILELYQWILKKICEKREETDSYGETSKLDVNNVLAINERVLGLGEQVAEYKIQKDKNILNENSRNSIRKKLVNLEREKQIILSSKEIAQKYGIKDTKIIGEFFQKIINLTTEAEIDYIIQKKKNEA